MFSSVAEAIMAYDAGALDVNATARIRLDGVVPPAGTELPEGWEAGQPLLLETTLGRALFNETLPEDYPYVNVQVDKKRLSAIVNDLAERYPKVQVAATLDALKEAGFHWATRSGLTVSISDVVTPVGKAKILDEYEAQGREGPGAVRAGPDHRRRAPPGAHRDLDPGDQRGRRRAGARHPARQLRLPHGHLRCAW